MAIVQQVFEYLRKRVHKAQLNFEILVDEFKLPSENRTPHGPRRMLSCELFETQLNLMTEADRHRC